MFLLASGLFRGYEKKRDLKFPDGRVNVRHLDGVDAGPPGRRQVGPDVVQKDDLLASQLQPLQQQADI